MVVGDNSPRRRHRTLLVHPGDGGGDDDHSSNNKDVPEPFQPPPIVQPLRRKPLQRKKQSRDNNKAPSGEPPFFVLVLQVGATLAVICFVVGFVVHVVWYRSGPPDDNTAAAAGRDDDDAVVVVASPKEAAAAVNAAAVLVDHNMDPIAEEVIETPPPFPVWNLTEQSEWDAFAIAAAVTARSSENGNDNDNNNKNNNKDHAAFWKAAAGLRSEFADTYGGENAARAILERALTVFRLPRDDNNNHHNQRQHLYPRDLESMACRMQHAAQQGRPFRMAFGGYSVTAGRGNYRSQSFPLVLEKLLHTVFSLLQIELVVKNAAIGGCPAFPYGWCMAQFWGTTTTTTSSTNNNNHVLDVVSWDYSMNEAGGDPVGLEAYLRHTLQLPGRPLLIVKDTHMAEERRNLLRHYATLNQTPDPVVIHTDPAARPFLDGMDEPYRPIGFQAWRQFGAPPGAPGQALHHPAVKEHAFIAWVLTMHFLAALQVYAAAEAQQYSLVCSEYQYRYHHHAHEDGSGAASRAMMLPPPVLASVRNSTKLYKSVLFGEPQGSSTDSDQDEIWRMNPVHCRTTFEPIVKGGELSDIIVSGSVAEAINIMLPKSKMFYNRGWVLDMSEGEKTAKLQLDRFGGLGFVDSKKAYYALPTSHTLRLLLPYEPPIPRAGNSSGSSAKILPDIGDMATDWFKSVVWCEVNEKRGPGACSTETDVQYRIGGVNVTTNNRVIMDAAGTLYSGKRLCTYLRIPDGARLTNRKTLQQNETNLLVFPEDQIDYAKEERIGLVVEANVINQHIINREDACSVSHVVWEQVTR